MSSVVELGRHCAPALVHTTSPASTLVTVVAMDADRHLTPLEVGVQFHGTWAHYTDDDRAVLLDRLVEMGATWVRLDVSWAMLQGSPGLIDPDAWGPRLIDGVVSMAHARGLKVLGTLWLTPAWAVPSAGERSAPRDARDYGEAFGWAAERWAGKVQAWEVWNEPNSTDFLAGATPETYTDLLRAAYEATRARSGADGVQVVYGGTMHNDVEWIERTYRAGATGHFDVMATHPYQVPADTGPFDGGGTHPWQFAHLGAVHDLMQRYQVESPLWLTELGWSSHPNTGSEPAWAKGVTEADQAAHTVAALTETARRYPFVENVFLYAARAEPGSDDHQGGYGIMSTTMQPKPVYQALRDWLSGRLSPTARVDG